MSISFRTYFPFASFMSLQVCIVVCFLIWLSIYEYMSAVYAYGLVFFCIILLVLVYDWVLIRTIRVYDCTYIVQYTRAYLCLKVRYSKGLLNFWAVFERRSHTCLIYKVVLSSAYRSFTKTAYYRQKGRNIPKWPWNKRNYL